MKQTKIIPLAIAGLMLLSILLTGCTIEVPEEYAEHPCVEFCYITSAEGIDPTFIGWYNLEKSMLNQVEEPICRNYAEIEQDEEVIQMLCDEDSMLRPMSPTCDGCDTFCDCQLADGSYVVDHAIERGIT